MEKIFLTDKNLNHYSHQYLKPSRDCNLSNLLKKRKNYGKIFTTFNSEVVEVEEWENTLIVWLFILFVISDCFILLFFLSDKRCSPFLPMWEAISSQGMHSPSHLTLTFCLVSLTVNWNTFSTILKGMKHWIAWIYSSRDNHFQWRDATSLSSNPQVKKIIMMIIWGFSTKVIPVHMNCELNPAPKPLETTRGLIIGWCFLETCKNAQPCKRRKWIHFF